MCFLPLAEKSCALGWSTSGGEQDVLLHRIDAADNFLHLFQVGERLSVAVSALKLVDFQ